MTESKTNFSAELLGASDSDALAALKTAGARSAELIEAWIKAANAAAVAEVAEHGAGPSRKAARRGLNVLKSRGIAIPVRTRVASLVGEKQPEAMEAWLLPPDTAGGTLVVVTARAPASRYRAAFVVFNDSIGVHRVDVAELTHSQLRESMARALPGAQYKPVKIPVDWARHRVAAARKRHVERGEPEPLGFTSAKTLLEPVPADAPVHPFDEEGLELAAEDAAELAKDSAKLHALPEFRGWFPTRASVEEMLAKIGEGMTPGEQPDADAMKAKLEAEILAATDRYFSPERRADLVRAMKDSGLSILAREGEQQALEVAATISCIASRGLITDAPHEVGFLKAFFEKAVSLLLAQGGGSLRIPVPNPPPDAGADAPPPLGDGA